jgi:hypothetical protein
VNVKGMFKLGRIYLDIDLTAAGRADRNAELYGYPQTIKPTVV